MNFISGNSLQLHDQSGAISNPSQGTVQFVALSSALVGTLTISNIITGNTPGPWVIGAGSTNIQTPPGSAKFQGLLSYALSNPGADADKSTIVYSNN